MSLTFTEFKAVLAVDLKKPQKEPRIDLSQESDSYYEEMGAEIERRPIGVPHRRKPLSGQLD